MQNRLIQSACEAFTATDLSKSRSDSGSSSSRSNSLRSGKSLLPSHQGRRGLHRSNSFKRHSISLQSIPDDGTDEDDTLKDGCNRHEQVQGLSTPNHSILYKSVLSRLTWKPELGIQLYLIGRCISQNKLHTTLDFKHSRSHRRGSNCLKRNMLFNVNCTKYSIWALQMPEARLQTFTRDMCLLEIDSKECATMRIAGTRILIGRLSIQVDFRVCYTCDTCDLCRIWYQAMDD